MNEPAPQPGRQFTVIDLAFVLVFVVLVPAVLVGLTTRGWSHFGWPGLLIGLLVALPLAYPLAALLVTLILYMIVAIVLGLIKLGVIRDELAGPGTAAESEHDAANPTSPQALP